jgi:hypothetical protein
MERANSSVIGARQHHAKAAAGLELIEFFHNPAHGGHVWWSAAVESATMRSLSFSRDRLYEPLGPTRRYQGRITSNPALSSIHGDKFFRMS